MSRCDCTSSGTRSTSAHTATWRWRKPRNRSRRSLRSEEHTSELQSPCNLVCRLLLEKKKNNAFKHFNKRHHNYVSYNDFPLTLQAQQATNPPSIFIYSHSVSLQHQVLLPHLFVTPLC